MCQRLLCHWRWGWKCWQPTLPHAVQARPHLQFPGQRELAAIAGTFGPATILYAAKTSAYLMIQASAISMSTMALAAHQPVWNVFGLVSGSAALWVDCKHTQRLPVIECIVHLW